MTVTSALCRMSRIRRRTSGSSSVTSVRSGASAGASLNSQRLRAALPVAADGHAAVGRQQERLQDRRAHCARGMGAGGLAQHRLGAARVRERSGERLHGRPFCGPPVSAPLRRSCRWLAAFFIDTLRAVTDHHAMLEVALAEARAGMEEGGIPIGGALFDTAGALLGRGRNQRVQRDDPSAHGETEAFRNAGRRRSYRDTIMATTLAPCWYCAGLIRQFGIGTVVVGESRTFQGGIDWLREC